MVCGVVFGWLEWIGHGFARFLKLTRRCVMSGGSRNQISEGVESHVFDSGVEFEELRSNLCDSGVDFEDVRSHLLDSGGSEARSLIHSLPDPR